MSIKFFVLGGGGYFGFWGGGKCRFYFYGREDFSDTYPYPTVSDFAGRNSDHGPSKTQTKTQPRQSLYLPGKRETQTMV